MTETREIRIDPTNHAAGGRLPPARGASYRKSLLALAAILALSSAEAGALDVPAAAAAIDRAAQAAIANKETPGLQVAVYKDGAPLLVKSYGSANLELGVPVSNDSVFRIGSVTKQFVAVALLQLQEEGKLTISDKLSKYYPSYPRAADITLAQMLHHTSGMHNFLEDEDFRERDMALTKTTDEWVEHFARMPKVQDFEPGTGWHYSNTAYFLLGGVVEKVTQQPLAAVFEERLFKPLGMTRTALDDEKDIVPGRVAGYDAGAQGEFKNARFISMTVPGAAGAMRSSAGDLMRWNSALFGGKLLQPASFQAMITPGRLDDGRLSSSVIPDNHLEGGEYGYGLVLGKLEGHAWIGHAGGISGFTAFLLELPDDGITMAVIANSSGENKGAGDVAKQIRLIVIGAKQRQ